MASHRYADSNSNSMKSTDSNRTRSDIGKVLAPSPARKANALGTMVNKFMGKGPTPRPGKPERAILPVPTNVIRLDLKNKSGSNFIQRKLFRKAEESIKPVKAITSARTLATVLRSERELAAKNDKYESEVSELRMQLEERDREVDKLKDLCLKQRGEIKALKDALLFPDIMNSQLERMLERRGSVLKQEEKIIPVLQHQVSSLSGQLQWLKEELSEVKAEKFAGRTCFAGDVSSPKAPTTDKQFANSLEYSSENPIDNGFGSPDDMLLTDFNPCLTPYFAKNNSKEFDDSSTFLSQDKSFYSHGGVISTSSEHCERPKRGNVTIRRTHETDESKLSAGKPRSQNLFGA